MMFICVYFLVALSLASAQQLNNLKWSSVSDAEQIVSSLHVFEQHAFPDSAGWSLCRHCGLAPQGILLYNVDSLIESGEEVLLSWSQWNEFFHFAGNDKYYYHNNNNNNNDTKPRVLVSNPLYVLPIIALHPGHLLIDLLENIYHDMQINYGSVRSDAIIVIDVAPYDQRIVLDDLLAVQLNSKALDHLGSLIQLFTSSSVRSISELQALIQIDGLVFENMHIGMNLERSWYYYGDRFRPFALSFDDIFQSRHNLQQWQGEYTDFVMKEITALPELSFSETPLLDVLVIVKKKNRAILNLDEVCDLLRFRNLSFNVVDLGELLFHEQVRLLRSASLVVAVAGTAIHNAQFLPPTSSIVMIMPPHWCEFSWMFTNQLILLDLRFFVLCSSDPACHIPTASLGLHRKNYRQGPRGSKLLDAHVDVDALSRVLNEVFNSSYAETSLSSFAHQHNALPSLREHDIEMTDHDKFHLIVSSVDIVPYDAYTEVNVFFDIIDKSALSNTMDEDEHLSDILSSLPYLAICCDFPSMENEERSCLSVSKMNYYASLRLNLYNQVTFSILHCWLQTSLSGGLMNSEVFWPIETRSDDSSFHALQCWIIQRDVRLRVSWRNYTSSGAHFEELIFFSNQLKGFNDFNSQHKLANITMVEEKELEFVYRPEHRFSLQMVIPEFCQAQLWDTVLCASFTHFLFRNQYQQMISEERGLPRVQDIPSPLNPFVFLHVEKSAGTTLRSIISNSSKRMGIHSFIPCFDEISCFTFALPSPSEPAAQQLNFSALSVLGGHFFWNIWQALPQSSDKTFNPTCFVMTRHPVQRILSFYNQRFFREPMSPLYGRDANSFSTQEWEDLLIYQRFARFKEDNQTVIVVDEGMSDAACRALAGIKTTSGLENPGTIPLPPELTEIEISQALNNAKECVVGVLEFWDDSIRAINHWFPWISFNNFLNLQLNQGTGESRKLRQDLLEVTLKTNKCDMLLHEQMLKQFESQKEILNVQLIHQ